ncbi:hypothetical protein ACFE04_011489 [Oxalis oulophora]
MVVEDQRTGDEAIKYGIQEEQEETTPKHHHPTPLHVKNDKPNTRKRHDVVSSGVDGDDGSVSCNKCRPNSREKISVVPIDNNNNNHNNNNGLNKSMASPNGILKSIFHTLTRRSPNPKSPDVLNAREEQWKVAVADISHKLLHATRKRDEAVLEASRLKYSMAELEKKLNKLEVYCHNLKSGLDECSGNANSPYRMGKTFNFHQPVKESGNGNGNGIGNDKIVEQFLVCVSEARSSVRLLSRALTMQIRHMGGKIFERISTLLQPYDIKISFSKNPKGVLFYLEALLNKAFFEDFESIGFQKNSTSQILNPIDRCETNYTSFTDLQSLTWEEVLNRGTRHFSEDFSRFCDRKMSEIVAMLGWNRAWPESLLQAFFSASKSVWLVHLLANSVHPGLPIFRIDKGSSFDSNYMEDMGGGDRARNLVPTIVRIMVTPGFYVHGNVVKCKVLSRYYNNNNNNGYTNTISNDKGITVTPSPSFD